MQQTTNEQQPNNEEIKYLKFVAIDNSLTDINILEDFNRVQFNPIEIDEISFYFSNSRYEWLLQLIKNNKLFDNSNKPISKIELRKHLKQYGKGFRSGYFNYLKIIESETELFPNENEIFINKVFSKVYDAINVSCLPLQLLKSEKEKKYKILEDALFDQGYIDGEIYKAWMIVAEYNPMFSKKWKKQNATQYPKEEKIVVKNQISKNPTDLIWFKIGLLFATGEIESLIKKHHSNFSQIAKTLFDSEWKSYRPYLSETYNNTSINNKNILSNNIKTKLLFEYCNENSIQMCDTFLLQYNSTK
ncbi:hypothetical protein [Maribacter aquivivus]|nr:hypothetical protein [Maribacter aquivivus]